MQTMTKLVICGLASVSAMTSLAAAQSSLKLSRADSVRIGAIIADFHREQVVEKGKCRRPEACRYSLLYGPAAQWLQPFVSASLAELPTGAKGTDPSVPYFGLRVKEISSRADTLVLHVDAIHRMANSTAWSEWDTALLLTRDQRGSLALAARRLVRISDIVPP